MAKPICKFKINFQQKYIKELNLKSNLEGYAGISLLEKIMEEAISTFGYTPYIQDPPRGLIVFAISIKARHTFNSIQAVGGLQ
ncbi:MAG: hypothetical protein KF862_22175 [Chitinophagaceae bacterium]|nr:hypothetical protein [Chitinophagaceae bacterium]